MRVRAERAAFLWPRREGALRLGWGLDFTLPPRGLSATPVWVQRPLEWVLIMLVWG